ncbi:MAG: enoyl-CoA hydratase/isomerase family protein [Acidobacteria bacterium]|nr:enoyl-CoA hydratase/isomerase family protein [Acidobacteriota bacterium]
MSDPTELITLEILDGVALLTLNDPARANVVSNALNAAVIEALDDLEARDDIGALIVTGSGRAFCAGAHLDDLAACDSEEKLRTIYSGFLRLAATPIPTVAAVNGAAVGAGLNMALACDLILAAESARFDTRFLQIGLHPGGGNTWRLRRITDLQTTMALVVFGEVVDGPRAAEIGLAWRCVPDAALLDEARVLAARAAAAPTALVQQMKSTIIAMDAVTTSDAAVDTEIGPQLWSLGQPAFAELLARLRAQIAAKS